MNTMPDLVLRCRLPKQISLELRRWEHGVYGYRWEKDRWEHMLVLYLSAEAAGPAMLEAALIDKYRRRSVCVY